MRFLVFLNLLLSVPAFGLTVVKSATTSIEPASCLKIKGSEHDDSEYECQGFGGYQVITGRQDINESLSIKFGGNRISFETPNVVHNLSGIVEWRYEHAVDQAVEMKALVYKLHTVDIDTLINSDFYYVVRLNKDKSCLIGKIQDSLDAARTLADDIKAKCL